MDFLKDYDFELKYHPRKENVVANALSRKKLSKAKLLMHIVEMDKKFRDLNVDVTWLENKVLLSHLEFSCDLRYIIGSLGLKHI